MAQLNNVLLIVIISISSLLILSISVEACIISPTPSESLALAPLLTSHISLPPKSLAPPAPAPVLLSTSYISSAPEFPSSLAPAPISTSYISSAPQSPMSPAPLAPANSFSYISSAPNSAPAASSPSNDHENSDFEISLVLERAIKNGINNSEVDIQQAQKLLEDPYTPSTVHICLRQCVENLGYVIDDFKKALGNVAASNSYLLSEDLAAASSDMAACEMCFKEINGGNNPLAEFERAVRSTSTQCLDIIQDYAN